MNSIQFNNADSSFKLSSKRMIRTVLLQLFHLEGKHLDSLSIVLCSDSYLLDLNKHFLNHEYYTDILTFDLTPEGITEITGELYISSERVLENAVMNKVTAQNEISRVILHGALHLCGYKDKTPRQIKQIREKEDYYLSFL